MVMLRICRSSSGGRERVIPRHHFGADGAAGDDHLGKSLKLCHLVLEAGEVGVVGGIVDSLLGYLAFHTRELAVHVAVEIEDLGIGVGVGIPELYFGFQLCDSGILTGFVTVDKVVGLATATGNISAPAIAEDAADPVQPAAQNPQAGADCTKGYTKVPLAVRGVVVFVFHVGISFA